MLPKRCPTNEVPIEEVHDRDRMMWLEQQIEALTQKFLVFVAIQIQQNQNYNPYGSNEDSL